MAFDAETFYRAALKKLYGLSHTGNHRDPPNEPLASQVSLFANQVIGELVNSDPSLATNVEYVEADLTLLVGSDDKAYQAEFPATYTGHFGAGAQGDPISDHAVVIPAWVNPVKAESDDSGGYEQALYDNGVYVPPSSSEDWLWDPFAGIVVSEDNLSLGSTGTIGIYLYTGDFVRDILTTLETHATGNGTDHSQVATNQGNISTNAAGVAANAAAITALDAAKLALALFDANTILAADTDDTPTARVIAQHSLVGNVSGSIGALAISTNQLVARVAGNLQGLSLAQHELLINQAGSIAAVSMAVQQVLIRAAGNITPTTIGEAQVLGRLTGGNLGANNFSAFFPVDDATSVVHKTGDTTAKTRFAVDKVATATTRVVHLPDADIHLVPRPMGTYAAAPVTDELHRLGAVAVPCKIVKVNHLAHGSGSECTVNLWIADKDEPESTVTTNGDKVFTSDLTVNTTHSEATTGFSNQNLSADQKLWLEITDEDGSGSTIPDSIEVDVYLEVR